MFGKKKTVRQCDHRSKLVQILLLFLIAAFIVALVPFTMIRASAVSQSDAVNWAKSKIGQRIDYDGVYGAQCVDLIKAYYVYLGQSPRAGNGVDYWNNNLPNGWTRISNTPEFVPQPGDIAVWNTGVGEYGHVAIVVSGDVNRFDSIDQNWPIGSAVAQVTHNYNSFFGVIRPVFDDNPPPSQVPSTTHSTTPSPPQSTGDVHIDYYNNIQLSGKPVWSENTSDINKNWGSGGPGNGVLNDNFSARFTRQMYFSGGWYKAHYEVDDAIKIWIDGNCKVDQWGSHVLNQDSDPMNISAGTHTIWVDYADYGGDAKIYVRWDGASAPEQSSPSLSPTLPPSPDLTPSPSTSLSLPDLVPAEIKLGDFGNGYEVGTQVPIWSNTINSGNINSGSFHYVWYINGAQVSYGRCSYVPANSQITTELFNWTPTSPGTYVIKFIVDCDQEVTESNENNNERSITITVNDQKRADLVPTAITYNSNDLGVGKEILLDSGVSNIGNKDSGGFNVKWYVNGTQVGYGYHDGISANTTVMNGNSAYYWTPSAEGTYTIKFVVDSDNQIDESNENNNECSISVTVNDQKHVDLVPTAITYNSNDLGVGKQILFDSGVSNIGNKDSGGFNVKWYVNGTQVGYGYHDGISANTTVMNGNSAYYWTPSAEGTYTIKFVVDSDNQIDESNENNNAVSVTVTVQKKATTVDTSVLNRYTDKASIQYQDAVAVLTSLGVLTGTNGRFNPKDSLTREQAAKIMCYITIGTAAADSLPAQTSSFRDVPVNRWSASYVQFCYGRGIITGPGDGTFNPYGNVTAVQFAKMLLVALGYGTRGEFTGPNWVNNTINLAQSLGILSNGGDYNRAATREEIALYTYYALKSNVVVYSASTNSYVNLYDAPSDSTLGYVTFGKSVG